MDCSFHSSKKVKELEKKDNEGFKECLGLEIIRFTRTRLEWKKKKGDEWERGRRSDI